MTQRGVEEGSVLGDERLPQQMFKARALITGVEVKGNELGRLEVLVPPVPIRAATMVWHLVVWLGAPGAAACSLAPAQHSSEAISLGDLVQQADWRVLLGKEAAIIFAPTSLSRR